MRYVGLIRLTAANASVFIFGGDKRQRKIRLLSQAKSGSVGTKIPRGLGWRDWVIRYMQYCRTKILPSILIIVSSSLLSVWLIPWILNVQTICSSYQLKEERRDAYRLPKIYHPTTLAWRLVRNSTLLAFYKWLINDLCDVKWRDGCVGLWIRNCIKKWSWEKDDSLICKFLLFQREVHWSDSRQIMTNDTVPGLENKKL